MSSAKQPKNISQAVREICLSLPATGEVTSHGSPDFRVEGKTFATYMINHHGDGHLALWLRMPTGSQEYYTQSDPERFYVPPYVGPKGWLGVDLDKGLSWNTIAELVQTAYAEVAPKALALDLPPPIRIDRPQKPLTQQSSTPLSPQRPKYVFQLLKTSAWLCQKPFARANLAVRAFVQVKRISAPCTFAASGCV